MLTNAFNFVIHLLYFHRYACQPFLMTPILNPQGQGQHRYNRAQIRGRNIIERTFGMMKRRFPCLNELRLKLETTMTVIVAVAVLWNLSLMRNEPDVDGPDPLEDQGDVLPPQGANEVAGQLKRQLLIDHHFASRARQSSTDWTTYLVKWAISVITQFSSLQILLSERFEK